MKLENSRLAHSIQHMDARLYLEASNIFVQCSREKVTQSKLQSKVESSNGDRLGSNDRGGGGSAWRDITLQTSYSEMMALTQRKLFKRKYLSP